MDASIITAIISAVSAIIVAYVGIISTRSKKKQDENSAKSQQRYERRMRQSELLFNMVDANISLTIGVAMALKRGQCNGEIEQGLEDIEKAREEYNKFLREIVAKETIGSK